jgi:ferredoxin
MAMKVRIDFDLCQGHGVCMGECPEVFRVNDDGVVTILKEQPDESLRKKVQNAARFCPTGAISID